MEKYIKPMGEVVEFTEEVVMNLVASSENAMLMPAP